MLQTLRREGNELVITVPASFVEQHQLQAGSQLEVLLSAGQMTVTTLRRARFRLEDLVAEMPAEVPMVDGWDDMKPVGREIG